MNLEQNTAEKAPELTKEERKNELYAQRKEMRDYGLKEDDSQIKKIDAELAELSKVETVTETFPEVVTAEMFVKKTPEANKTEEWRTPEERFAKTQLKAAKENLAKIKAGATQNPGSEKLIQLYESAIAENQAKLNKINEELQLAA